MANRHNRYLHEVVVLSCDCELGKEGERGVVVDLDGGQGVGRPNYMTLLFPDRTLEQRKVCTGADYLYLNTMKDAR